MSLFRIRHLGEGAPQVGRRHKGGLGVELPPGGFTQDASFRQGATRGAAGFTGWRHALRGVVRHVKLKPASLNDAVHDAIMC